MVSGTEITDGINYLTFDEVSQKVDELLPQSKTALKIVLAVTLSAHYKNPVMLWLLLVGVPSSGKTDLVRLVKDVPGTYYLDNMTMNAFISGERPTEKEQVHHLLPLLNGKCWVIKDWTGIFALDEKMTKKILGEMVNIFDKEYSKHTSKAGTITFYSEFSHLGCITPATLNKHTHYMNMVGPRFLFYSIPDLTEDQENESFYRIFNGYDRASLEVEAKSIVGKYIKQLKDTNIEYFKPISSEAQNYLKTAALLMANCRGIVSLQSFTFKNEEGKDTTYYEAIDKPQIEQPWRGVQQLITLAKYLAIISGKDEIGVEELQIIKDIVLSSMPADRAQALRVIQNSNGEITAKELAELSERNTKTSRRLLDELVALKVLEKSKGSGTVANDYQIVDRFRNFILVDSAEFLSHKDIIQPADQSDKDYYQEIVLEVLTEKDMDTMPF